MIASSRGGVAAGHAATAEAGALVLRDGGNAVDAAVAAVCTSFIAEPVLTGAGGGGFLLLHEQGGKSLLYDGFARMPGGPMPPAPDFRAIPIDFGDAVQTFHTGRSSVATPSLLAMLFAAHRRHGRLPVREVLAPAMHAGRDGIRLNALQASFLRLLEPILSAEPECRRLHAPTGELPGEGELFRNPELANTLEMLALEGIEEMYHGDLARAIADACTPGGLLGMDDLTQKQVHARMPLKTETMGGQLLTNPPPSSGGCLIAFTLRLIEMLKQRRGASAVTLAECLHATSTERRNGFDEQIHHPEVAEEFLSAGRLQMALDYVIRRLDGDMANIPEPEPSSRHGSTTHISVVDGRGMAVSVTTSNGEGSGIVVPGTGIHLNNMLGEEDINPLGFHRLPGGATLPSMMAPSIFLRQGRPLLVLGSGGSNRLRGAIVQVLLRHIMRGQDIESAVHAPRLHNEDHVLDVEPGRLSSAERQQLLDLGWEIRDWQQPSVYFGGVHAISISEKGQLQGAGDPRRGGCVAWA